MTTQKIETNNLLLRPIQKEDIDRLYEMYTNPRVMKYILDGSVFTRLQTEQRMEECLLDWKKHGFGLNMMIEKSTGEIAGYCVLRYFVDEHPELNGEIEIGYILDEPYWGKGYATEAVKACIQLGFEKHHFKRILATILPDHIASQQVVKKAGMVYTKDLMIYGLMHQIYEIKQ